MRNTNLNVIKYINEITFHSNLIYELNIGELLNLVFVYLFVKFLIYSF